MKEYFNSLNEREKWMLVLGGTSLVLYLFYLLVYAPLSNKVFAQSTQLVEKRETLQWMKKIKQEHHAIQTKKALSNSQLLTLIAVQLKENDELNFPYQLQQTGSGEIQLSFDEVPINQFLKWLAILNDGYSFSIKQFDVERSNTPGITRIMIIINAGS